MEQITIKSHKDYFSSEGVVKSMEGLLGSPVAAKQFAAAMLQIVTTNDLANVDPKSVYMAGINAVNLRLSVQPFLGHCYFVSFNNRKTGKRDVQFILGYKGLIQLCIRSGLYESIQAVTIYKNEFVKWDKIKEQIELKPIEGSGDVAGYYASFRFGNFEKSVYWSKEKVLDHAKRFSKSYNSKTNTFSGPWQTDFDRMAEKTVLLSILKVYGIMTPELEKALDVENAVEDIEVEVVKPTEIKEVQMSDSEFLLAQINSADTPDKLKELYADVIELAEESVINHFNAKAVLIGIEELVI